LLGTSVDDTFIMLSALIAIPVGSMSPEDRIALMLKRSGPSMLMTTITDVLAFLVGALTSGYPAVQSFCWFCLMGTLFDFCLQITWCVAWAYIDAKRQDLGIKNQLQTLCCCRIQSTKPNPHAQAGTAGSSHEDIFKEPTNPIQKLHESCMNNTVFRVFVLLAYAGVLAGSINAVVTLHDVQVGQDLRGLAMKGSYLIDYFDDQEKYFAKLGLPVSFTFTKGSNGEPWKYWDVKDRATIGQCLKKITNQPAFKGSTHSTWYNDMEKTLGASSISNKPEKYMVQLKNYLNIRQDQKPLVVENSDRSGIAASMVTIRTANPVETAQKRVSTYSSILAGQEACDGMGVTVYASIGTSDGLKFFHADYDVTFQILLGMGLSVAGVAIVVCIFIPNFFVAAVTTLAIVSIDILVLGYMFYWGQSLNTTSMISLLMSIGFSADFVAHISLGYTEVPHELVGASRLKRTIFALREVGPPVAQAGISTFCAIIPIAVSKSQIFFNFFSITCLVLLFGLAHGLFILPALFSFVGPTAGTQKEQSNPSEHIEIPVTISPSAQKAILTEAELVTEERELTGIDKSEASSLI